MNRTNLVIDKENFLFVIYLVENLKCHKLLLSNDSEIVYLI